MKKKLISKINLILLIAILVVINLISVNSFFHIDLTKNNDYSLSRVSLETLSMLEDPLRVKVFYSSDLPAPYNGVRQYLMDILREYDRAEKDFFSYEIVDMSTDEGKAEARNYGLQQVEIQEVQSDEFQSRAVNMGAVILYGTAVERVDHITDTSGLEYRLTTAMSSAVNQIDALSGYSDIEMKVLASPSLGEIRIQGFPGLKEEMQGIFNRINEDNFGRLTYEFIQPSSDSEIDELVERFGVQPLHWKSNGREKKGLLSIVLRADDKVERVPLEILSQLFGGYTLDSPEAIETSIRQSLRSLVSTTSLLGYATGNGEKDLSDNQQGAGPFSALLSSRYKVIPVNLSSENIPAGIDTLIINGPEQHYSEQALYRIDQFLMSGGSLLVFSDSYQQMMIGSQPRWVPLTTGLEALIEHYGISQAGTIVLDEESYRSPPGPGGQPGRQIFQAPILGGEGLSRDSVITSGLGDIIGLNLRNLTSSEDESSQAEHEYISLLRSSSRSWTVDSPEQIGPWTTGVPSDVAAEPLDIAVLLEGDFSSWFSEAVDLGIPEEKDSGSTEEGSGTSAPDIALQMDSYLSRSVSPGKVLVIGSSAFTTPQLLDPRRPSSNGNFLMNCVDYLNGMPGMAELRNKGSGAVKLKETDPAVRSAVKWINTVAVPLLVVITGLTVWFRRRSRARRVQGMFRSEMENK